jgi:hypothetical protein
MGKGASHCLCMLCNIYLWEPDEKADWRFQEEVLLGNNDFIRVSEGNTNFSLQKPDVSQP